MRLQSGQVIADFVSAVTVVVLAPLFSSSSAMFCQPDSSATCITQQKEAPSHCATAARHNTYASASGSFNHSTLQVHDHSVACALTDCVEHCNNNKLHVLRLMTSCALPQQHIYSICTAFALAPKAVDTHEPAGHTPWGCQWPPTWPAMLPCRKSDFQ